MYSIRLCFINLGSLCAISRRDFLVLPAHSGYANKAGVHFALYNRLHAQFHAQFHCIRILVTDYQMSFIA